MIWLVRKEHPSTMNTPRVRCQIAERINLTLECIRRHFAGEQRSPLAKVIKSYEDYIALLNGSRGLWSPSTFRI